jgi:hypothetical protein
MGRGEDGKINRIETDDNEGVEAITALDSTKTEAHVNSTT